MEVAAYGSWASPIGVEDLTAASIGLSSPRIDGGHVYWLQSRADEGGRTSVWRRLLAGGEPEELTPAPSNVRSRVHEYGGGEYDVRDGVLVYSEVGGQVFVRRAGTVRALTPESTSRRYADLRVWPGQNVVLAVREDHGEAGEPVNTIVALDLEGPNVDGGTIVCSGADFYSTPELSAGGSLAWTQWMHPAMPWDATEIRVATLVDRALVDEQVVAGGPHESAVHPRWRGSELIYLSDRTDWWNPYGWAAGQTRALCPTEAEWCEPQWVLGAQPYAVAGPGHLLAAVIRQGRSEISLFDRVNGELRPMTPEGVGAGQVSADGTTAAAVLDYPDRPSALALLDLTTGKWEEVIRSNAIQLDPASVSVAQQVSWSSDQGPVYGWYYPPTLADVTAPAGTRPPLITLSHGGPTAAAGPGFRLAYQFWTTRGYAVLDVDYGGSTGYGRAYRQRLQGHWGIVDVADCAAGARAMGHQGRADPDRLIIKGGSAGGYTTLRALTSTTVFAAGVSQYGIGELEALARDTHKFESRYLDGLVGPYPQAREVYLDRSPINHLDQLAAPVLLLQGRDDFVVPPAQAERMADAARAKGLAVAVLIFDGEGHGFRRAETIRASLQAQLYFLGRVLGCPPADQVPAITIDNLD